MIKAQTLSVPQDMSTKLPIWGTVTCEGWKPFQKTTIARMFDHLNRGWEIIIGNDWRLDQRKRFANWDTERLAQTNSRTHGRCVRTVWAVKPNAHEYIRQTLTKRGSATLLELVSAIPRKASGDRWIATTKRALDTMIDTGEVEIHRTADQYYVPRYRLNHPGMVEKVCLTEDEAANAGLRHANPAGKRYRAPEAFMLQGDLVHPAHVADPPTGMFRSARFTYTGAAVSTDVNWDK